MTNLSTLAFNAGQAIDTIQRTLTMTILTSHRYFKLPRDIAVCPICGADISIEVNEIEKHADGWRAGETGIYVDCSAAPDDGVENFNGAAWLEWREKHSGADMEFMTIHDKAATWLDASYRFILEDKT